MKKLLAIAFVGGLVLASCSKKETTDEMNATTTPEVSTVDTVAAPMDSTVVTTPMEADSTATK